MCVYINEDSSKVFIGIAYYKECFNEFLLRSIHSYGIRVMEGIRGSNNKLVEYIT